MFRQWRLSLHSLVLALLPGLVGFNFSEVDDEEAAVEAARARDVEALLATPCSEERLRQRIMLIIAERSTEAGVLNADQSDYTPLFNEVDARLQDLGLRTVTQAEIRSQVAAAELEAYFNNDPDAAIAASKRHATRYVLRGLISSRAERNAVINVNQVAISLDFTLLKQGRRIGAAHVEDASFAGTDTQKRVLSLVRERADEIVAQVYADFCAP